MSWQKDYINRITQGDCVAHMKDIPDNSIDMVCTSPPYNLGIPYDTYKDDLPWNQYYDWCRIWIKEVHRILKSDGRFCLNVCMTGRDTERGNGQYSSADLFSICRDIGLKFAGLSVWTEPTITKRTAWGSWMSASAPYINCPFEVVMFFYKEVWKRETQGKSTISAKEFADWTTGIWNMQSDYVRMTEATFPEELPDRCVKLFTYEGDIVLDPFSGSGTTALVCKKLKRNFIGFELSPVYTDRARRRLQEYPDKTMDEYE